MNEHACYAGVLGLLIGIPEYGEITAHGRRAPFWIEPQLPRPVERPRRTDWPSTGHTLKGLYPSGFR